MVVPNSQVNVKCFVPNSEQQLQSPSQPTLGRGAYRGCDLCFAKSRTHHTAFSVSKIILCEEEENSVGS